MSATIHRLESARRARRRKKTERQKYSDALLAQMSPRLEDWERELNSIIGPPSGDTPPGGAA